MSTELSPQARAELTEELHDWVQRWSVDPGDLEVFMDEVEVVIHFNEIVGDDHSAVTTNIPAAARAELSALITRIARQDADLRSLESSSTRREQRKFSPPRR